MQKQRQDPDSGGADVENETLVPNAPEQDDEQEVQQQPARVSVGGCEVEALMLGMDVWRRYGVPIPQVLPPRRHVNDPVTVEPRWSAGSSGGACHVDGKEERRVEVDAFRCPR